MSFTNSTTFGPEVLNEFWSTALLKGATIASMTNIPGVKAAIKIPTLNLSGLVQADSCAWNASGNTVLDEVTFTVCGSKVNLPICVKDLEPTFLGLQMKKGALNSNIPATMNDYLLMLIADNIAADRESNVWIANSHASPTVGGGCLDGLLYQFGQDSDVVDVAISSPAPTASTILAEMKRVVDALPTTMKAEQYKSEYNFYIPSVYAQYFEEAMVGLYTGSQALYYSSGIPTTKFMGYPVIVAPGLPAGNMVLARSKNLVNVNDSLTDSQTVEALDQSSTGSLYTYFVARWKDAFGYLDGTEIVWYH
jgi:hypothetical protein